MANATLNQGARTLLSEPMIAVVATTRPDGSPHTSPTWIDIEGDEVVINTLKGRQKARNLRSSPKIAVCVVDPQNAFRVVSFEGTVTEMTEDGADDHIDRLTMKYMGIDKHPWRHEGDVRIIVRIRPDRVLMQPAE